MLTVFLDLDETLIKSFPISQLGFVSNYPAPRLSRAFPAGTVPPYLGAKAARLAQKIKNYDWFVVPGYVTCWRPGLQEFLNVLFSRYRVAVWTAASADYAAAVVRVLKLSEGTRKLDFLLHSDHAEAAGNGAKNLSYLPKAFGIQGLNPVIVDDLKLVNATQPDRSVKIAPFKATGTDLVKDAAEFDRVLTNLEILAGKLD